MHILLFFIDGLGLGTKNPECNPLLTAEMPNLQELLQGKYLTAELGSYETENLILIPVDAGLGVAGIPQSATGQTALFTGVNAAELLGSHLPAFPTARLKEVLSQDSMLKKLREAGAEVTSANAYTPNYFELVAQKKRRHSASTLAVLAAGIELRQSLEELNKGNAVYQDMTNTYLRELGFAVNQITPEQAGVNLARIVSNHHFTLYEYFQTDMAGHSRDREYAERVLQDIDDFLGGLIQNCRLEETLIIITSDHGNIEDICQKSHTQNQVPCLLIGAHRQALANRIKSLTDVTPSLIDLWHNYGRSAGFYG